MATSTLAALALGVAACTTENIGADQAELANMREWNKVPRSSPAAFVRAFKTFCLGGSSGRAAIEPKLRRAGYVPIPNWRDAKRRAYVVDDARPLVAVGPGICLVRAKARSGQTERFERFVASEFPNARSVEPRQLSRHIERGWAVNDGGAAIIATERKADGGVFVYSALVFRGASE